MEKRLILALVLSLGILILWQVFFGQQAKPVPPKDAGAASGEQVPGVQPGSGEQPDPEPLVPEAEQPGRPAVDPAALHNEVLENDHLRVVLTNRGAAVESAHLIGFWPSYAVSREEGEYLEILRAYSEDGPKALGLEDRSNAEAWLGERYWETEREGNTVRFTTRPVWRGAEYVILKEITLPPGPARHLRYRVRIGYPEGKLGTTRDHILSLFASGGVYEEAGAGAASAARGVLARTEGNDLELQDVTADQAKKGEKDVMGLTGPRRFVADVSSYFGAFLDLGEGFPERSVKGRVSYVEQPAGEFMHPGQDTAVARTASSVEVELPVPWGGNWAEFGGLLYLGPVDPTYIDADDLPESVASAFDEVYRSTLSFSFIGDAIMAVLRFLHGLVGNWGWAIVLLTLVVRLILFPINRRSQGSMARHSEMMARIKPRLAALKEKYKDDSRKYAEEQMKLMKAEGVRLVPLGDGLPLLLQIPIFWGLFSALRTSISLRQASWLWVHDLSQPDYLIRFDTPIWNPLSMCGNCCGAEPSPLDGLHLLPILMTIAWMANSYLMPRPASMDQQAAQQRKMMMFMPLLFGFMMYSYAAGLSLYWLTSSLFGIIETRVIRKFFPLKTVPKPQPASNR